MELETFDCNRCGASLTQVNEDTYKCEYCGKVYHAKDVAESTKSFKEMFDASKREHINNLRRNLYEATNAMFISSKDVEACADELKHEIPDDFLATFFKIAAGHDDKAICKFIRKIDVKKHYSEIDHILNFLIRSLQPAFMLDVGNLIERAYKNTDLVEYEKHATALSIEQEKVKKGIYEVTLPREAFIAYSSKDMEKVTELVEVLESQGIECFVAARNLRHGKGAVENYNKALEDAMDHCKCFVFVSSLNSRSTGCDAVRIEIPHIQKVDIANAPAGQRNNYALVPHEFKKPRVEYRIEESNGFNVADKITNEFFEGYERVYSPEEVAVRVFKQITAQAEKKVKYCRSCGEEHDIEAKFCSKCANSVFVDDAKLVDHSAPVIAGVGTINNTAEGVVIESDPSMGLSGGDATIKRGFMHLSYGEFEDADNVFEKALDINSKNAHAYLGKLMVNLRVKNEEELIAYPRPFNDNKYFKYAIRWADSNFQRKLNGFIDRINDRIEGERKDAVLKQACDMMEGDNIAIYQKAISLLESISPWKESKERIDECYKRIEAIELMHEHERMDRVYEEACNLMNGQNTQKYRDAISKFCSIPQWKDSKEKIEECNRIIESIEHQNEHDRQNMIYRKALATMALQGLTTRQKLLKYDEALHLLESIQGFDNVDIKIAECNAQMEIFRKEIESVRQKDAMRRSTRKTKKAIARSIFAVILAAVISFAFIFSNFVLPDTTYAQAVQLMETGDYGKALTLLNTLDGFKDSDELIVKCRNAVKDADYNRAVQLMNDGKWNDAIAIFQTIVGYKDSSDLLVKCRNAEKDKTYADAMSLMQAGNYSNALELFKSLGGYKDATEKVKLCQTAITEIDYKSALALYNEGKYEEAMNAFQALGSYSNCVYLFELCRDKVYSAKYEQAIELMNNSEYVAAYTIFQEISGYKDVDELMAECYAFSSLVFTLNDDETGYIISGYNGSLKSVVIPSYYNDLPIVAIDQDAFFNNSRVESIIVPEGVTKIESYAFSGCTALESIVLPDRVLEIGKYAFSDCNALESITLPFVGFSATDDDYNYLGYIFGADGYTGNESYVPSSLKTVVVNGGYIANYSFYNCSNIVQVTLPENIARIGNCAFQYCYALRKINIPTSVVSIGEFAFYDCGKLNDITLPDGLTTMGNSIFAACDSLSTINIPNGITAIPESAFNGCSALKTVSFGNSLESIGNSSFRDCTSLADISLPITLASIDSDAFFMCSALKSIVIPEGVKTLGWNALYGCSSLESITLPFVGSSMVSPESTNFGYIFGTSYYYDNNGYVPSSLKTVTVTRGTSIAPYAFYGCNSIVTIVLPDTLTSIGQYALYDCLSLKELTLPFVGATRDGDENTYFGYIFGDSNYYIPSNLRKLTITDCTKISDRAFYECNYITEIVLPVGIESIGTYAFAHCEELRKVYLPRTITLMGEYAFAYDYNLSTVTFAGSEDEWNSIGVPSNWLYNSGSYTANGTTTLSIVPVCNGDYHGYIEVLEAVAPTCEDPGYTEGMRCTLCDITLVEQEEIAPLGHITVQYEAKTERTYCDEDIWDAYEACEREGCTYSTLVIDPGTDHVLISHEGKHVDCNSPVGEIGWNDYVTCENCSYTDKVETVGGHILVHYDKQDATCDSFGWEAYDVCQREGCGYTTYSEIAPLGHSYNDENVCEICNTYMDSGFDFLEDGNGGYYVNSYNGSATEVNIPKKYNGAPVTYIGANAFYGNTTITKIVIPDSITSIGSEAFNGCTSLSVVEFGNGIQTIGSWAFASCTALESIVIPSSVQVIQNDVFIYCNNITSIELPFIGSSAVNPSYTNLAYIFDSVPESLKTVILTGGETVPYEAFYGCSYIENIILPDTITTIESNAFYNCSALVGISIPDAVTSIGSAAFYGCSILTEFIIPTGVTYINDNTFYGCSSLDSITLHDGITYIGRYAFGGCTSFTEFTVPQSVTQIDQDAFRGCTSLESITLPFVGNTPSSGYSNFGFIFGAYNADYQNRDWGYDYIPQSLKKVTITGCDGFTKIASNAFLYCANIEEIVIHEGINYVGTNAFSYCSALTSVSIPEGVITIGDYAFMYCTSLASLTIPSTVTTFSSTALYDCSALEDLTIPVFAIGNVSKTNLKTLELTGSGIIGSYAFDGCSNLRSIMLSEGITSIGDYAFNGCSGITSITVPNSVTTIGQYAFNGCYALESITLPFIGASVNADTASASTLLGYIFNDRSVQGNTSTIAQYYSAESSSPTRHYLPRSLKNVTVTGGSLLYGAFSGCQNISITIGDGVTNIDSEIFARFAGTFFDFVGVGKYYGDILLSITDTSVESYEIMAGTRIIASGAFADCTSLSSVTIPESVTVICSSAFANCTALSEVNIPNSITSIGARAFEGCLLLSDVTIPEGVGMIGDYAFAGCVGVTSLTLNGGGEIGDYAFMGMSQITDIIVPDTVTRIGEGAFSGCSALESISLPFIGEAPLESYDSSEFEHVLGYIFGTEAYTGGVLTSQYSYNANGVRQISYYVPESLKTVTVRGSIVPYGAFSGCSNITTVILENTVTGISDRAFYNAAALANINIPESVTSIGVSAFYGCATLTELTIPNTVTSIGKGALEGCTSLVTISIPFAGYNGIDATSSNTLGYIFGTENHTYNYQFVPSTLKNVTVTGGYNVNGYAFRSCTNIESIIIEGDVTSIGNYAFYDCTKLTNVVIPDTVTSIGSYAFYNCDALTNIDLPEDLVSIGDHAFYSCDNLAGIELPGSLESIGEDAFADCKALTSITVPGSVTYIGERAFAGCDNLESIELPFVGATADPEYAAYNTLFGHIFGTYNDSPADALTSVVQYYSSSGYYTYYIPAKLKTVTITGGKILYGAFYGCNMIEAIIIGDGVESLGENAFYGCSSLTDITLGDGIVSIGHDTFSSCVNLQHIILGDNVTEIGERAFMNCSNLLTISIPECIESIANTAFEGCTSLVYNADDDGNVLYLGNENNPYAVLVKVSDTSIESYVVDSNVRLILEGAFEGCTALETITISEGVTAIGDNAFNGCIALREIIIPDTVVRIGEYAFNGCAALETVTIGKGVNFIGKYAFFDCDSLYSVIFSDPNGWSCYPYVGAEDGEAIFSDDISTADGAWSYLTQIFFDLYWIKNNQ